MSAVSRVVCVPDSFKGSVSASEAAAAMARGARQVFGDAEIMELPFADGGEGTLETLLAVWGTEAATVDTVDALDRSVRARYGRSADGRTAIIEAAEANGLPQVSDVAPQPRRADTYGVGRIARHLLEDTARPVEEILICLGGSATTDGGTGILRALGARFVDADGAEVSPGGAGLADIAAVETTSLLPAAARVRWRLAVDVENPLIGPRGAAAVFGPQKGASEDDVAALDAGLAHLAEVLAAHVDVVPETLWDRPGFGAAGGIPVALSTLLGAEVVPGAQMVAEAVGLREALTGADLILTGEGSLDTQSLDGKVVAAVREHAPGDAAVVVIAGTVRLTPRQCRKAGLTAAFSLAPGPATLDELLRDAATLIEDTTAHACALLRQ